MPVFGPHPVTVPGAVEAWFTLIEKFATRSFGELAAARAALRRGGLPADQARRVVLRSTARSLYDHFGLPDFHDAYGDVAPGDWVRQPELAAHDPHARDDGPDAYYRGPIGAAIAERMQRSRRLHDRGRRRRARRRVGRAAARAVSATSRSSRCRRRRKGVTALEALRIVDGLDLGADGPDRQHLLIEAVKLALADRRRVPRRSRRDDRSRPNGSSRDDWIAARRADDRPAARARRRAPHAEPDGGTIYMCAADRDGMLVSLIQSNFRGAGSGLRVREWGLNLHNRGSAFVLDDAHPNGIGPDKMPLHTLIPAMALRDGRPWMVFGTEGGHGQAQTHTQLMVRMLVDGDDPQRAISAPRFTIDPGTGRIAMEDHFDPAWIDDLRAPRPRDRRRAGLPPRPGHRARDPVHRARATSAAPIPAPRAARVGLCSPRTPVRSPYAGLDGYRAVAGSARFPNRHLARPACCCVPVFLWMLVEARSRPARRGRAARGARRDRLGRRLDRAPLRPGQRARQDPRSRPPTACCSSRPRSRCCTRACRPAST